MQWNVLANIQKMSQADIDLLLQKHIVPSLGNLSTTSDAKPWETPNAELIEANDFPKQIVLTRANMLYIPLAGLSARA